MNGEGWKVGIKYTAEGQGITDLAFDHLPPYDVGIPREDAVGTLVPRATTHGYQRPTGVLYVVAGLTIMKGEDHSTSQAKRVDGTIENMCVHVGGEVVWGGVAEGDNLVWGLGGVPSTR